MRTACTELLASCDDDGRHGGSRDADINFVQIRERALALQ